MAEAVEAERAEKLDIVEQEGETVTAETGGFSFYTVEFTYQQKQYVLDGGETVLLSDVLAAVGLQGEVESALSGSPELFSVEQTAGGAWMVYSHAPFQTEEWLRVTIAGVTYKIDVTDSGSEQGSVTITFGSAGSNDSTIDSGNYRVSLYKECRHILSKLPQPFLLRKRRYPHGDLRQHGLFVERQQNDADAERG